MTLPANNYCTGKLARFIVREISVGEMATVDIIYLFIVTTPVSHYVAWQEMMYSTTWKYWPLGTRQYLVFATGSGRTPPRYAKCFPLGKTKVQFATGKNSDLLHLSNKQKNVKF